MDELGLPLNELLEAMNGESMVKGKADFNNVCIDTREIEKNNICFAISGERFNGNKFVVEAFSKGASIAIVDEILFDLNNTSNLQTVIKIENTEKALLNLVSYYRKELGLEVIGVTGSCGKTSTKDLIAALLSEKYKAFKTKGNFDNRIGLSLMILELDSSIDVTVLEIGMSSLEEIDILANYARPGIVVITNIGLSHVENLRTQENILKAKSEIFDYLGETDTLIINSEDESLLRVRDECFEILKVGCNHKYDVYAFNIILEEDKTTSTVKDKNEESIFTIPMVGKHNILSSMLTVKVAKKLNAIFDEMKEGIRSLEAISMRLQAVRRSKITTMNDRYDASPDSMKSPMDIPNSYRTGRKIAILGTMSELGEEAIESHIRVGNYALTKVDSLITAGEYKDCFKKGFTGENIITFATKKECIDKLDTIVKGNSVVLMKTPRDMKFEDIVSSLEEVSM